jgi:hypothetical protein
VVKVRADFVTNSSTTSFVIISDTELARSDFLALVGVSTESPLAPVFDALLDRLLASSDPRREHGEPEYFASTFSDEVANRVAEARQMGREIYVGELSSDNEPIETLFCCDSFELESEAIYLNALRCVW